MISHNCNIMFFIIDNYFIYLCISNMAGNRYVSKKARFGKKTGGKLRKRWYFNAGANLPFVGRTNVSFGTTKAKRSVINMVRQGLEDPQHKLYSQVGQAPPTVSSALQNTLYNLNLTGNIPQGTAEGNRTGDNIHLDAFKMKINFYTDNATNKQCPVQFRVMLVKHDIDTNGGSDAFASGGIGAADLFQGNNAVTYELPNPKKVTVLYDKLCTIIPQFNDNCVCTINEIIRLQTTHTYKTATNYGKYSNYYLMICGSQPAATSGVTVIGGFQLYGDLIFKDSK